MEVLGEGGVCSVSDMVDVIEWFARLGRRCVFHVLMMA